MQPFQGLGQHISTSKLGNFESTPGAELWDDDEHEEGVFFNHKGREFLVPWGQIKFAEYESDATAKLHERIKDQRGQAVGGVRVVIAEPARMISNKQEYGKPVAESLTGDDATPVRPVQVPAEASPAVAASRAALAAVQAGEAELNESGEVVPVEAPAKKAKSKR